MVIRQIYKGYTKDAMRIKDTSLHIPRLENIEETYSKFMRAARDGQQIGGVRSGRKSSLEEKKEEGIGFHKECTSTRVLIFP